MPRVINEAVIINRGTMMKIIEVDGKRIEVIDKFCYLRCKRNETGCTNAETGRKDRNGRSIGVHLLTSYIQPDYYVLCYVDVYE